MTPVRPTLTALRPLLVAGLALAAVVLVAPGAAFAQGDLCIEEASGQTLQCAANDVSIALVIVGEIIDGCDFEGDTAVVTLRAELQTTANERYDIGFFIATDGGDARTGDCERGFLDPPTSDPPMGGVDANSGVGPYPNFDGDACGDIENSVNTIYYRDIKDGEPVTITCVRSAEDPNFVEINACTSWENNLNAAACTGIEDAIAPNPSKCNCETTTILVPIVAAPSISVIKKPDSQTVQSGDDAVFTIEVQNIGDTDLENVVVDDPLCDTLTGPEGDDGSDGILSADPGDLLGETWTYICTVEDVLASFTNSVTVTADIVEDDGTVTDTDTAVVIVVSDIPTVSGWGLAGLALLLGGLAFLALRRRRAA